MCEDGQYKLAKIETDNRFLSEKLTEACCLKKEITI